MGNYFEPVLSEEQMAAYLDGMLSSDDNNMVEELMASNPEMVEIQDVIDSVDSTYIYETDGEVPIECMADDFSLPDIRYEYHHSVDTYETEEYVDNDEYNDNNDYQDDSNEMSCQDESLEMGQEDSFVDNEFYDLSL